MSGFALAGVRAQGSGALTIGSSSNVHRNGTQAQPAPGVRVAGTATVRLLGGTTASPTRIAQNAGAGVDVSEGGRILVSGVASTTTPGVGDVVVTKNGGAGVVIEQALVTLPPYPPASDLDGVVSAANGGSGLHVFGGSAVKVRNSVFLKNVADGVRVSGNPSGAPGQDFNDVSRIDLGSGASYGRNIVQDTNTFNEGVGICLALVDVPSSVTQTLQAAGNVFAPTLDCSVTPATLQRGPCSAAQAPIGIEGALGTIDVSICRLN